MLDYLRTYAYTLNTLTAGNTNAALTVLAASHTSYISGSKGLMPIAGHVTEELKDVAASCDGIHHAHWRIICRTCRP